MSRQITGKGGKPISAALAAAMGEDAGPAEDKLDMVRRELRLARDKELELESMQSRMKQLGEELRELKEKTLIDAFDEARITKLGLPAEGNLPGYEIEIRPYYKANIGTDWEPERRSKAFWWLDKNGHGDLLRQTVTVSFGPKTTKAQATLAAFLKKNKMEFSSEYGVPWNTLTAWLKNMIEVHKKTPPLDTLGATVGRVASVVKQKKEK